MAKRKQVSTEDILNEMSKPRKISTNPKYSTKDMLSTGSTLLDLSVSGNIAGSYVKGRYYYYVGDSSSGKTWLVLTCFAEAVRNRSFDNYRLIFDDVEDGALMNLEQYFGKRVQERVEPPRRDKDGQPMCSETIEDMYDNIMEALDEGTPFIYVTDSVDALTSVAERTKTNANRLARRKGTKEKGSMGDGKAKKHSEYLRQIRSRLLRSGSILILISQTRDNLSTMSRETVTRAGGRALRFYSHVETWTSVVGYEKKEVHGTKFKVTQTTRCRIKKNRLTGRTHDVNITIRHGYGVDDIADNIKYLIEAGSFRMKGRHVFVPLWDFEGTPAKLLQYVEENSLEHELKLLTASAFNEAIQMLTPKRKKRYE